MNPTPRIPENYRRVCPRLFVADADAAIAFSVDVLGATERRLRLRTPDGKVLHSALVIGDSLIMVSVGVPELTVVAPDPAGTTTVMLHLHVEDVAGLTAWSAAAGARTLRAPRDEFYGDRTATIADPFGHRWGSARNVEDVCADEMARRVTEFMRPDRP